MLSNISGTCGKGFLLANVHHAELKNITVTGFAGPLLSTYAAPGKGLNGVTPLPAPKVADAIAVPAQPYILK